MTDAPEWRRNNSCLHIKDQYGGYCKHVGHLQQGGGTTSPDHSYIYCTYLNERIYVDPPLASLGTFRNIRSILMPDNCPMLIKEKKTKQAGLLQGGMLFE